MPAPAAPATKVREGVTAKLSEVPDHRDTPEAQMLADDNNPNGETAVSGRPLLTANGLRPRLPAGMTSLDVNNEKNRKRWSIGAEESLCWVTDTQGPGWRDVCISDQIQDTIDAAEGSRVVCDPVTNRPIRRRDSVLMAYPRVYDEMRDQEEQTLLREQSRQLRDNDLPGDNRKQSEDDRRRMAAQESNDIRQAGIIGPYSPTDGMTYAQAAQRFTAEQIMNEARMYREGGRSYRDIPESQAAAYEAEVGERMQRASKGAKTFGGLGGFLSRK